MSKKRFKKPQITLEARIDDRRCHDALRQVNAFLCDVSHKLWVDLHIKGHPLADVKREALVKHGISGRHFNSIRTLLDGKAASIRELNELHQKELEGAIKETSKSIRSLEKDVKIYGRKLKAIQTYRGKVANWRLKRQGKKPKPPALIRKEDRIQLHQLLKRKQFTLHQKKRRRRNLEHKLQKIKPDEISLAFGSKQLFKKQFHLRANGYTSHQEWLEDWRFSRHNQSYWLGSHEESGRNLNAQYDPHTKTIKLRVPEALESQLGTHITVRDIRFVSKQGRDPDLDPMLADALFKPRQVRNKRGEIEKRYTALSYRVIERSPGRLYIQVSFEPQFPEKTTSLQCGAIGFDLNADHIAVVETDRFGNGVAADSYPFDLDHQSSDQTEAILGDYIAAICDRARASGKSIAIERLDFAKKKQGLREKGGRRYAQMLSSFIYKKFDQMVTSRCAKTGVGLKRVNPAFSSIIGFVKYHGYSRLSSHQKAALVIARRAMDLSERPKFHGTRVGTASILEASDLTSFECERRSRHVWSFYAKHAKALRMKMRTSPKEVPKVSMVSPQRPSGFCASLRKLCEIHPEQGSLALRARLLSVLERYQLQSGTLPTIPGCWG